MKDIRKQILEAKDVSVYKMLLNCLGEWTDKFPASGLDTQLDTLMDKGKKLLPKDKRALDILEFILVSNKDSVPGAIQQLLNVRFLDLPTSIKPITKNGRRYEVAFWCKDGKICDKVKDLIDFADSGKAGFWCDTEAKKVVLLDSKEE